MRRMILSICAVVVAVGLGASQPAPEPQRVASPSPSVERQSAQEGGNNQSTPSSAPIAVTIVDSPAEAEHSQAREAKSDAHDAEDLDAQVRAADAAEQQVLPSWFAALLSFAGTGLIVWSLAEARAANRIAQAAVADARGSAERQLRAYVNMTAAHLTAFEPGQKIRAVIEVRNTGLTPARQVMSRWGVYSADFAGSTAPPPFPEDLQGGGGDIATQGSRNLVIESRGPARKAVIDKCKNGSAILLLFAEVVYLDVFGAKHTTTINLIAGGTWGVREDGTLTTAPEGNSSD